MGRVGIRGKRAWGRVEIRAESCGEGSDRDEEAAKKEVVLQ